jgi:serine phosphatase RsbU (regulator of sigma subunit)
MMSLTLRSDVSPIDDEFEGTIFSAGPLFPVAGAADDIGHYLVVVEGSEPGKRIELDSAALTIGRDAKQATMVFPDTGVSRVHAMVRVVNGKAVVEDLQSTNGTFVDATRVASRTTLREGNILRMGAHALRYERRSRKDVQRTREMDRDLLKARKYVQSLLPAPIHTGPVLAEWSFVPSSQLGGDAFGYYWLDPTTFVFYLVDVSGHGVGSAMHSVTVLNVLRQRALPNVDFRNPSEVLANLNDMFQGESHNGLMLTMWYGVYRTDDRVLTYGSAGHHPAYLVPADRQASRPIGSPALMIGGFPDMTYQTEQTPVPAESSLYLFSDGLFEIVTKDQQRWELSDLLPLLLQPGSGGTPDVAKVSEAERVYNAVREVAAPGPLEDDVSLLVVTFT